MIGQSILLGVELMMIPLAPLVLFRCLLANPACSLGLKLLLFAVGALCPLAVALLLARFWLVWGGYLFLLAFDIAVALALLTEFV